MTAEIWQPLSAREVGVTGLREGVSDALAQRLRTWLLGLPRRGHPYVIDRVLLRLDVCIKSGDGGQVETWRAFVSDADGKQLIDLVDAALYLLPVPVRVDPGPRHWFSETLSDIGTGRKDLERWFEDAASVYMLKDDGRGLETRTDPAASALLNDAIEAASVRPDAGSAARQLREASDAMRALHPQPDTAYRLAVSAVESAAHAIIEPNNRRATLGTMLGMLASNPTAFEVEIAGPDRAKGSVAPMAAIMRMLWEGQTSRHGSKEPTRKETAAEAEMAVQLASVLVLWFTTGNVRRRS